MPVNKKIRPSIFLFLSLASLAFLLYGSSLYLGIFYQGIVMWGFLALLWALKRARFFEEPPGRIFYLMLAAFIILRYWMFRTFDSLVFMTVPDMIGMSLLYIAEGYGILICFLGMFVSIWPVKREKAPLPLHPELFPTVDIFIPTYDEPAEIVKITALACTQLDYPREKLAIYILDDGATLQKLQDPDPEKSASAKERQRDLRSFAESQGITYLAREKNVHAKAGNINEALSWGERMKALGNGLRTGVGELILFLDCDHAPTKDFLKNTVGFFSQDEKLFVVQTPHFFINPTPIEKNLETFRRSPGENEMFYGAIQVGLDFWNSSFFCGSAALMRRKYLVEIGGIQQNSITEDAETSLVLHSKGYNSAYLAKPMVCGLSPETFHSFILQRSRWTQGMIQIFLLKNPLAMKGLSLAQRLCYANSCLFWFFGLARIVFFISPLLYLYGGIRVYNASPVQVLMYTAPYILASILITDFLYGRVRHPFFSELYETVQSIFLVPAIIATLLNPRAPRFKVTPKGKGLQSDFLSPLAAPFYILFCLCIGGLGAALWRWWAHPAELFPILICVGWLIFNSLLVMLCLGIVWESRQKRRYYRIWAEGALNITFPRLRETITAEILDVSLGGISTQYHGSIPLEKNEEVEIHGFDGYGEPYRFQGHIVRIQKNGASFVWGLQFNPPDLDTLAKIVGFVFGDSNRWSRIWELGHARKISIPRSLYYLMRQSVRGTKRNFRGILPTVGKTLLHYTRGIWNNIQWWPIKVKAGG